MHFLWIVKPGQKYIIKYLTIISNPFVKLIGPILTIMTHNIVSVIAVYNPIPNLFQCPISRMISLFIGNVCEGVIASKMSTA